MLDSLKRHVVAARAKEDFVGKVGQERQRVVAAGRQVSRSLELGAVGVGQRIDPGPSRERLPVVTQEQLVISTGQERLALFWQSSTGCVLEADKNVVGSVRPRCPLPVMKGAKLW